jgi:hypothetical protein
MTALGWFVKIIFLSMQYESHRGGLKDHLVPTIEGGTHIQTGERFVPVLSSKWRGPPVEYFACQLDYSNYFVCEGWSPRMFVFISQELNSLP